MTPKAVAYLFFFLLTSLSLQAQVYQNSKSNSNTLRNSADNHYSKQSYKVSQNMSFRIEGGKFWVNGNLLSDAQIPASLRSIDPSIYYQTAVIGMDEIGFQLYGNEYLVKDNRIVEVPPTPSIANETNSTLSSRQLAAEEYYSQLRKESPGLFKGINQEGLLYERCRDLVIEYQQAKSKDRSIIREELRTVLAQLFDLNERNRELEIKELEQMIEAAKKEVQFRKSNKNQIINNALNELLTY